jgi:hypothetical protein
MIGEGDSLSHAISLKVPNEFLFGKTVIEHICNTLIKFEVQLCTWQCNFCIGKIMMLSHVSYSLEIGFENIKYA